MIFKDQEDFNKKKRVLVATMWVGRVAYFALCAGLAAWLPLTHALILFGLSVVAMVGFVATSTLNHLSEMIQVSNLVRETQALLHRATRKAEGQRHE